MELTFTVPDDVEVGEQFNQWFGTYTVRELSAQQGIDAVNALIAESRELQENPNILRNNPQRLNRKMVETATTFNGEPLTVNSLDEFPNKIWQFLVAANERLNGISDDEARFLLKLSGRNVKPPTPPSP